MKRIVRDDSPRILTEPKMVFIDAGYHFSSERNAFRDPTIRYDDDADIADVLALLVKRDERRDS